MKKGKMVIRTRPVGDVFLWNGKRFEVVACDDGCYGCSFYERDERGEQECLADIEVCGLCFHGMRTDNKSVVFLELTD